MKMYVIITNDGKIKYYKSYISLQYICKCLQQVPAIIQRNSIFILKKPDCRDVRNKNQYP